MVQPTSRPSDPAGVVPAPVLQRPSGSMVQPTSPQRATSQPMKSLRIDSLAAASARGALEGHASAAHGEKRRARTKRTESERKLRWLCITSLLYGKGRVPGRSSLDGGSPSLKVPHRERKTTRA